jgi:hypothetical protein
MNKAVLLVLVLLIGYAFYIAYIIYTPVCIIDAASNFYSGERMKQYMEDYSDWRKADMQYCIAWEPKNDPALIEHVTK